MEYLIGINAFSAGIYATKVVQGVRISRSHKAIFGGVYPNTFIYVDGTTNADLQDYLDAMRYYEKNPYLAYEAKLAVVSIQRVQVGK